MSPMRSSAILAPGWSTLAGAVKTSTMFVVYGTKKFRDRVKEPVVPLGEPSTTALRDWYATALFWKPQVALFVNEPTLLPVLVPLAPAASVIERFPASLATVLTAHGIHSTFIEREVAEMKQHRLAKTINRSVVGIMNEFAFLGGHHRTDGVTDLVALSLRLAQTPCSPLYKRHTSPDRELAAFVCESTSDFA